MIEFNDRVNKRKYVVLFTFFITLTVIVKDLVLHWHDIHFFDAHMRWQECAYVLKRINPFDVMWGNVAALDYIGSIPEWSGSVPWEYVLGNLFNPSWLSFDACILYMLFEYTVLPIITCYLVKNYLIEKRLCNGNEAWFWSLAVFSPYVWGYAIVSGNQGPLVSCLIIIAMTQIEKHEFITGLLLGVAMCKPQLAFLFFGVVIVKKKWRVLWSAIGIVMVSWLLCAILIRENPIDILFGILSNSTGYQECYFGLFDLLLKTNITQNTNLVLAFNICVSILLYIFIWKGNCMHMKDDSWLLWFAEISILSTVWFYKQPHDFVIMGIVGLFFMCKKNWNVCDLFIYLLLVTVSMSSIMIHGCQLANVNVNENVLTSICKTIQALCLLALIPMMMRAEIGNER